MSNVDNIRNFLNLYEKQLNESTGKYSPTVSTAYSRDQEWWKKNGGEDWSNGRNGNYDNDGYDSYGYNEQGKDRAGYSEEDYMFNAYMGSDHDPEGPELSDGWLFDRIGEEWSVGSDGKPAKISETKTPVTIETMKFDKTFKNYIKESEKNIK